MRSILRNFLVPGASSASRAFTAFAFPNGVFTPVRMLAHSAASKPRSNRQALQSNVRFCGSVPGRQVPVAGSHASTPSHGSPLSHDTGQTLAMVVVGTEATVVVETLVVVVVETAVVVETPVVVVETAVVVETPVVVVEARVVEVVGEPSASAVTKTRS